MSFCLYLPAKSTKTGTRIQELLKCGEREDERKDTPTDLIRMFLRGRTAKPLQQLLSHFIFSLCLFSSPTPTHKHRLSWERNLGFGNESLLNIPLHETLFSLETQQEIIHMQQKSQHI